MTQDSTAERRRSLMAVMDDKKETQAMASPKMPDTIWARPEHTDDPAYGPWWQTYQDADMVAQYTRTDLSQAAIAAAEKRGRDMALDKVARHADTFMAYLRAGEASVNSDLGRSIRAMKGGE